MDTPIGKSTIGEMLPLIIVIGFLSLVVVFCIKMVVATSKAKKAANKTRKLDKQNGVIRVCGVRHIAGLNAPENCVTDVAIQSDKVLLSLGGNEFGLSTDKIKSVDFQMDIDVKQYLKSSKAKGIVGAAAFGVAGAVIGSAPKTKEKREVIGYAIISFVNAHGELSTIVLRDENANTHKCASIVDKIRPLVNKEINRVEM